MSAAASPDEPTDWPGVAGRDLNCADDRAGLVEPVGNYDIDGDGVADQFVTMRCRARKGAGPEPGQLEVFRGGSPRDNPKRMAVLVRNEQGLQLSGCLSFVGDKVFIPAVDDGKRVVLVASWDTTSAGRQLTVTRYTRSASVPGCP